MTLDEIDARIGELLSDAHWRRAQGALASGSANDVKSADRAAAVLDARTPQQRVEAICTFFLTGDNGPRKSLMTKTLASQHGDVLAYLSRAQDALPRCTPSAPASSSSRRRWRCCASPMPSCSATPLSRPAAPRSTSMISSARRQPARHHASAEWVLFKLDGGLDHMLVDEAQDTSPVQWDVIEALAREFFCRHRRARRQARTFFAVGDEKQSIYCFQGARPELFARLGRTFAKAGSEAASWRRRAADVVLPLRRPGARGRRRRLR